MQIYRKNVAREKLQTKNKIKKVYLSNKFKDNEIITLIKKKNINPILLDMRDLDKMCKGLHQGIILEVEDVIDIDNNNIVTRERNTARERERELLEQVSNLLRIKNNSLTTTRINKKWLIKYQYVYKLAQILMNNDMVELEEAINHPSFKEIYDYDLDRAGLYENLRNKIYEMPIYIFLRILTFAILYNDEEFFDGIYKIMKYKIQIDKHGYFKEVKRNDSYGRKQLKSLITFMQKISIKFDNKNVFELERIEKYVKLKSYVNN